MPAPDDRPRDAFTPRPRLTLRTLTRGDGLLGLKPHGPFGARGGEVTVAQLDWTWRDASGHVRSEPIPADALPAEVAELGLHPVAPRALQWRTRAAATGHADLWSLPQERHFSDLADRALPRLEALGWRIVVEPGYAHAVEPVERWRLRVEPLAGARSQPSWLLSLGIEIGGRSIDLAPLIADLLKRDARWLDAEQIAAIDDAAIVQLRTPEGKRIAAPAAPLKAVVGGLVDLLVGLRRGHRGPLALPAGDALRLDALAETLAASDAGGWSLEGAATVRALAQRLREAGDPPPQAPPEGLGLALRPYQLHGLAWLQHLRAHGLGGLLADDMGLGKTAQALAHLLLEVQAGRADRPSLVVLPTSLVFHWQAEAARIAPALRVLAWHGSARLEAQGRLAEHDLVLTSYALVVRDIRMLQAQPWHVLVIDEAQAVKNAATRAARALRRLDARHRLALTATPLENHLGELWAQFDFLMPGFLGDARRFARVWRRPIEDNGEVLRMRLLAERIRPFVLRRRKALVAAELPPRTEAQRLLVLQGPQRSLYESVRIAAERQVRRALDKAGFDGARLAVLDALLKLRQVCCDPALLPDQAVAKSMPRAKLELLREMLPALVAEGRRVLVFSQFTRMLALVEAELRLLGVPALVLTGRTPAAARGALIRRFQAARDEAVLLASLKVGGVGLNLTAADTVILVEPWWNPAVERQAADRAHRIGQTQPVVVYRLVVDGSIESRMRALQARKTLLAAGVLDDDDGLQAPALDEAALAELLAPLD